MKNNRPSTQFERNYALRRIVYNTLIAAKSVAVLEGSRNQRRKDFSAKETAKVAGLMMARNLDEFFYKQPTYKYDDDIFVSDFNCPWVKPALAQIDPKVSRRISKLAGHIVAKKLMVFSDDDAIATIRPLVQAAVDFINCAIQHKDARYSGLTGFYTRRLNGVLTKLNMPRLK